MGGRPVVIDPNAATQQSYELDEFLRKNMPVEGGPSLPSRFAHDDVFERIQPNLELWQLEKSVTAGVSDSSWDQEIPELVKAEPAPTVVKPAEIEAAVATVHPAIVRLSFLKVANKILDDWLEEHPASKEYIDELRAEL